MSEPEDPIDRVLRLLMTGGKPSEIAFEATAGITPAADRALVRRCAVARTFDENLAAVLAEVPTTLPDTVPFDRLADSPFVERVPNLKGFHRIRRDHRERLIYEWDEGKDGLTALRQRLVAYHREASRRDPVEELYQLARLDPDQARSRFEVMFKEAENGLDLARCDELLGVFSDIRRLPTPLRESIEIHRARLNARSFWQDEFYRTGSYLERKQLINDLDRLMTGEKAGCWNYQIYATGGTGKTMFVRWAIARWCVERRIPCARIDFDFASAGELASHPDVLALVIARQWNRQIAAEPFGPLIDRLSKADPSGSTNPLAQLAAALTLPAGVNALVVLDTLEEVLIPNKPRLIEILGHLKGLHDRPGGGRVRVMLAGRYDLRKKLDSDELAVLGAAPIHRKIFRFKDRESRKYLTEIRGLPEGTEEQADRVQAAIERSRGNPLKLQLFSEILMSEPSLTGDSIRSDVSVEVEYLIRRVVLRIGENQKDPRTGEIDDLHKQLRWVLRYGVVPRQLTLDFLLADPIRKRIERESRGEGAEDKPEKGLENLRTESPVFLRSETPPVFLALWEELKKYAGGSSWVRVATESGEADALVFTPDVVYPMRALLLEQEHDLFAALHGEAMAYFQGQAEAARSLGPAARVRGLREVVYHDFQRRGEAAGAAWRNLLTSEEFRDNPTGREILAEEVTGRAYLMDDDPPRPILRKDKTRMIAPETLALAYYHRARALADQALTNPDDARQKWNDANNAFSRFEQAASLLTGPVTEPASEAAALLRAVIQANAIGGDRDAAITVLRTLGEGADQGRAREALRELARLLILRNDPDAEWALKELIARNPEPVVRVADLRDWEALVRQQLAYDHLADALATCDVAIERARRLGTNSEYLVAKFDLLARDVLLRSGQSEQVFEGRRLPDGSLIVPRPVPETWAIGARFLEAGARLAQLDAKAALAIHREARELRRKAIHAQADCIDLLPEKPLEREQRALISRGLMDGAKSLHELNIASGEWLELARPGSRESAALDLAEQVSINLHLFGDLIGAGALLAQSLPAEESDPGKSKPALRITLLRAALAMRLGESEKAWALFDKMLARTRSSPPRFRVLSALSALEFAGDRAPASFFESLVESLGAISPPSARLAMLGPLERCPLLVGLPESLVARFLSSLPDLSDSGLAPRDRAVLKLRLVEALRVVGRADDAVQALDQARNGLLGAEELKSLAERNMFPLRDLLRAEDRLGRAAEACRRGKASLPSFAATFAGPFELILVAGAWVEQAERALIAWAEAAHTKVAAEEAQFHEAALDEAIAEAWRRLEHSQFAGTNFLIARLFRVRAGAASRRGFDDDAVRHQEIARKLEESLGIPIGPAPAQAPPPSSFDVERSVPLEVGMPLGVESSPVPPPLVSVHSALTIKLEWKTADGLSVTTHAPSALPLAANLGFPFLDHRGLGRAPTPVDSIASVPKGPVMAFVERWDLFADELSSLLMPPATLAGIDASDARKNGPADVRLAVMDSTLSQLPWEFLRRPDGDRAFLSLTPGVRYLYRSGEPASGDRATIRWLQSVLNRLFDRGLQVDGTDSVRLRKAISSFQAQQGLEPTGAPDANTRWALDRAWRLSQGRPPRTVVLITALRGEELIQRLYAKSGYEVVLVSSRDPELSELQLSLQGRPLSFIHVDAPLDVGSSLGVCFSLAPPGQVSTSRNTVTPGNLDAFMRALPETDQNPVVVLAPPLPSSPFEAALQLFMRNAFATELFRLGNAPAVLATGLAELDEPESSLETLVRAAARGESVGDVLEMIRLSPVIPGGDEARLGALLFPIGTAFFAHDPDSRVPGAELDEAKAVKASPTDKLALRTLHALLVGINDYPSPIPRLRGCINDIELFGDYLTERVNASQGVSLALRTLKNAEATREAVIQGFREHLVGAGPGDVALFYFSGHGSQAQVPEEFWKVEPDHLDETLLLFDSRTAGSWDLAGTEIAKLIGEVAANGPHVVLILDCCHSGSGTRDIARVVRRAPTDFRRRPIETFLVTPAEAEAASASGSVNALGASWHALSVGRHVLLVACRDDEEAQEYVGDGRHRGAFSYFLGVALKASAGVPNYRDLQARVGALVSASFSNQHPQMSATRVDDLDTVFLDGAIQPAPARLVVSWSEGQWTLDIGSARGIPSPIGTDTARVALFSLDAGDDDLHDPSKALATAGVVGVTRDSSQLALDGGVQLDTTRVFKASIISLPTRTTAVSLEGDGPACALVRQVLAGPDQSFIHEAATGEEAAFRLVAREGQFDITRPEDDRAIVAPVAGNGLAAADLVVARLTHIVRWTRVAHLINPASSIQPGDVKLSILVDSKEVPGPEIRLEYQLRGGKLISPRFQLSLTNNSPRTLFCGLLDLTQRYQISAGLLNVGCIGLLPGQTGWALGGNQIPVTVPDAVWSQGVIEYRDILKLIVSTSEFDARLLEQPALDSPPARGTMRSSERQGSLNILFQQVQTDGPTVAGEPTTIDDWQTSEVTFTTVRPLDAHKVPALGQTVNLLGGAVLEGHPNLKAVARLSTEPLASRDLGNINLPRLLVEDPRVCVPLTLAAVSGGGPGLSVLEMEDVADPSVVTPESPLRLTIPRALGPGEHAIVVAYDGEFFLPVGRVLARSTTSTTIAIEGLPPPLTDGRSLSGAIKLFFEKVIRHPNPADLTYPVIAAADVATDETVTLAYDSSQVRFRVANAARVLLFVPGIVGDGRDMAASVQRARLADGRPLAALYDLVLTFEYQDPETGFEQNGRMLRDRLKQVGLGPGHGKALDIVAHSTGGIVARRFVEHEGGHQMARRLVMLGTPNAGWPWPRFRDWAGVALSLGFNDLTAIAWPASVLKQLAPLAEGSAVALNELTPGSPILEALATDFDPGIPYNVLAGSASIIPVAVARPESTRGSILERLLDRLTTSALPRGAATAFFLDRQNDMAVSVGSMCDIASHKRRCNVRPVACDHLSYFRNPESLEALAAVLDPGTR